MNQSRWDNRFLAGIGPDEMWVSALHLQICPHVLPCRVLKRHPACMYFLVELL